MDLEQELDRLYQAPLAEFVAVRNELVRRLRAAGDRPAAERSKTLAKPSPTAWAVNQLRYHAARELDELLAAGARLRAATLLGGATQRAAMEERRRALAPLLAHAAELLAAAGHAVTPASRQRVSRTLEALAARRPEDGGPPAGRLCQDLEPPGFEALADLSGGFVVAEPAATSPAVAPAAPGAPVESSAARRVLAQARLATLEHELDRHEQELAAALAAQRRLEQAARLAAETLATAQRRAREAEAAATVARRDAQTAAEARDRIREELAAARDEAHLVLGPDAPDGGSGTPDGSFS